MVEWTSNSPREVLALLIKAGDFETAKSWCNLQKLSEDIKLVMYLFSNFEHFSFCSQIKCWCVGLEFTKCLSEYQTGKTLIRLLLQKQSDLGLHCLSKPFGRQLCNVFMVPYFS